MKLSKKITPILCAGVLLCYSVPVYAAGSYSFNMKFKHQVAVGFNKASTQNKAQFLLETTKNDSDDSEFKIKQFIASKKGFEGYVTTKRIQCKEGTCSGVTFDTTKGVKYTYEFWKVNENDKGYISGKGYLLY